MTAPEQLYLGDGVYLRIGPWGDVVLTTENGERETNRIVLEPDVYTRLAMMVPRLTGLRLSKLLVEGE